MRPGVVLLLWLACISACATTPGVASLDWLEGCWQSDNRETGSGEQWSRPMPGIMLGLGRIFRDGRVVSFEVMHISDRGEDVVLVAIPPGQAAAEFIATGQSKNAITFANPAHDFPQSISYRRDGDRLIGRIEGTIDGKTQSMEFPLHRVSCPANEHESNDEKH